MGNLADWIGLGDYTSAQWEAFGTMITAVVAIAATVFAWLQVRHARAVRDEQAQPYIVVDFEEAVSSGSLLDIVVKNTGSTVAHDVRLTFDPPIASTLDGDSNYILGDSVFMTKGITTMPPGRTWRALFENMPQRYDRTDLPREYLVQATYNDSHGKKFTLPYRLDLDIYFGVMNVTRYGAHDAAKAIREISSNLKKVMASNGLRVWVRDEDYKNWADRWQRNRSGGQHPSLGMPFPAGRPSPHKYDTLENLVTLRRDTSARRMRRRLR